MKILAASPYAFAAGWVAATILMLVDIVWHSFSNVPLPLSLTRCCVYLLGPHIILYLLRLTMRWLERDLGRSLPAGWARKIHLGSEHVLLTETMGLALLFLIYYFCALGRPLIDTALVAADAKMGFDWRDWFRFSQENAALTLTLASAYKTLFLQFFAVSLFFAWKGDRARLYEYFWLLSTALFTTACLFALFPAVGPAPFFGMAEAYQTISPIMHKGFEHMQALRAGTVTDFHDQFAGIISFPSFHSAAAVIISYTFRRTGGIGYAVLGINMLMLAATLYEGSHYLTDMLAGILFGCMLVGTAHVLKKLDISTH